MKNFTEKNLDREARGIGDNLVYAGFLSALVYGMGVLDRDVGSIAAATGFLFLFYVVYASLLVRRVAIRTPPGDRWRAAAFIAYGGLPFGLLIPFWSQMTGWPGAVITFPPLAIWVAAALILAMLERPTPGPRRAFLGVAGAIFAIAAGPIYLGFAIGLFTGAWTPPDGNRGLVALALVGGLPWALGCAYAAIELLGRANVAQGAADPT